MNGPAAVIGRQVSASSRSNFIEKIGVGAYAGSLGAGLVALAFLITDLMYHQAFWSPQQVASALFGPSETALTSGVDLGQVALYSVAHAAIFVVIGVVMAFAVRLVGANVSTARIVLGAFLFLELGFYSMSATLPGYVAGELGHGVLALGNLAAAVGIGTYLSSWRRLLV